ncbi:MAG: hypothetical protein ACJAYJ_001083 [Saprospiraceae bacterium]|jgi:hypothetical protein
MESNNNLRSWNFNASNNRVIIKNSKENFGTFSFEEIRSSSELKFKQNGNVLWTFQVLDCKAKVIILMKDNGEIITLLKGKKTSINQSNLLKNLSGTVFHNQEEQFFEFFRKELVISELHNSCFLKKSNEEFRLSQTDLGTLIILNERPRYRIIRYQEKTLELEDLTKDETIKLFQCNTGNSKITKASFEGVWTGNFMEGKEVISEIKMEFTNDSIKIENNALILWDIENFNRKDCIILNQTTRLIVHIKTENSIVLEEVYCFSKETEDNQGDLIRLGRMSIILKRKQ